jgi:hypothetical protein
MSLRISPSQLLKPIAVGLVVSLAAVGYGCKKDEPPPPLPSAAPAPSPTPTAALELEPEDAGIVDAADDADAAKKGGGGNPAGLLACCKALEQNAASAPEPNKTYMLQAAAGCKVAAAAGQTGAVQAALRGAGLPGCK